MISTDVIFLSSTSSFTVSGYIEWRNFVVRFVPNKSILLATVVTMHCNEEQVYFYVIS